MATTKTKAPKKKAVKKVSNTGWVLRSLANNRYLGVREELAGVLDLSTEKEFHGSKLELFTDIDKAFIFDSEQQAEAYAKMIEHSAYEAEEIEIEPED